MRLCTVITVEVLPLKDLYIPISAGIVTQSPFFQGHALAPNTMRGRTPYHGELSLLLHRSPSQLQLCRPEFLMILTNQNLLQYWIHKIKPLITSSNHNSTTFTLVFIVHRC